MAHPFTQKLRKYFDNKRGKFDNINEMFHFRYYKKMFNKKVMLVLSNGDIIRGVFCAEIKEEDSIKVGENIVKINDIDMIKLLEQ